MGKARDYIPALKFGNKIMPEDLAVGNPWANYWYVDEDNGSDSANNGSAVDKAVASLEQAISNAGRGDVIFVRAQAMATGAIDPESYTENAVITADKDALSIVGVPTGRVQGGLPQLKVGSTTTQAILTVRAPGCLISNLGFNGAGATGGGILLDDDGSTKSALGTTIENCHFKNCVGTTATNAATGGAIQLSGAPWQILIKGNRFYKNVGDVVLLDTSNSVPQDIVIEDNIFSGPAANTDCNLYLMGGSGINGVIIRDNVFTAMPALGGTNDRFIKATSCVGILANNFFNCATQGSGLLTFKAAGTGAFIPTTMFMAGNYGEADTEGDTGYIYRAA
jgi:hypothetical protein